MSHRVRTWIKARALSLRCALTSHDYGQHFSDIFGMPMNERSWEPHWCSRCGLDR